MLARISLIALGLASLAAPSMGFSGVPALALRRPVAPAISAMPLRMADSDAESACEKVTPLKKGITTEDDDIDEEALAQCQLESQEEMRNEVATKGKPGEKGLADESF
mmetsp:Transcript_5346/g.12928  ORF Transcript_5346/g.12928 Transcript_5346/m.12928 type:complete len:108 (-) Transcript_5346:339-662(-)|eukprot:CAMPEP_0173433554 /NCGR_PEP_ID=MMETSP1357-20121228/10961_1 /TAXON_ID=77926 /ORGANISM="Hemiselmis rufescens, Strain PCC563" /LENGTH=107 /DNA_ID=CAMNT_0014398273 /DNA_START=85 /DNA_END=408 /DNA_ORIENTATION=+